MKKKLTKVSLIYILFMLLMSVMLIFISLKYNFEQYIIYFSYIHAILITAAGCYSYKHLTENKLYKFIVPLLYILPLIISVITNVNIYLGTISLVLLLIFNIKYCAVNSKNNAVFSIINTLVICFSVIIAILLLIISIFMLMNLSFGKELVITYDSPNGENTLLVYDETPISYETEKVYRYYVRSNKKSFFFVLGSFIKIEELKPECNNNENCSYTNNEWIDDNKLILYDNDEYLFD